MVTCVVILIVAGIAYVSLAFVVAYGSTAADKAKKLQREQEAAEQTEATNRRRREWEEKLTGGETRSDVIKLDRLLVELDKRGTSLQYQTSIERFVGAQFGLGGLVADVTTFELHLSTIAPAVPSHIRIDIHYHGDPLSAELIKLSYGDAVRLIATLSKVNVSNPNSPWLTFDLVSIARVWV